RIRVGVGAARDRQHRGELRVAQARQGACEAGDHEAQHHGGARIVGSGLTSQHEDASAEDGAEAEQDEVTSSQYSPERDLTMQAAFDGFARIDMRGGSHRLRSKYTHALIPPVCRFGYSYGIVLLAATVQNGFAKIEA